MVDANVRLTCCMFCRQSMDSRRVVKHEQRCSLNPRHLNWVQVVLLCFQMTWYDVAYDLTFVCWMLIEQESQNRCCWISGEQRIIVLARHYLKFGIMGLDGFFEFDVSAWVVHDEHPIWLTLPEKKGEIENCWVSLTLVATDDFCKFETRHYTW